jgi:hypothetical protein
VLIILALGIGGIVTAVTDGPANHLTVEAMLPSFGDANLPAGDHLHAARLRLLSSLSEEIKPERTVPRTIFTASRSSASSTCSPRSASCWRCR